MTETLVRVGRPAASVAMVTFDRPDTLNAMNSEFVDDATITFDALAADDTVDVVVLTGAGRGFNSGADLRALGTWRQAFPDPVAMMHYLNRPYLSLRRLPQITIAAINGPAMGAGWGLALGCDFRIASPAARFGATFVKMGLGPDYGVSQTLPQLIGRERALELLLTGDIIDAREALRIGAVSSISDDPVASAIAFGELVTQAPGRALRSIKRTLDRAAMVDIATAVDEYEAEAQGTLFTHPDLLASADAWLNREVQPR